MLTKSISYLMYHPFALCRSKILFQMLLTSISSIVAVILFHSFITTATKACLTFMKNFVGLCLKYVQIFSIGFQSGDFVAHGRSCIWFSLNHSLNTLETWHDAPSFWKMYLFNPIFSASRAKLFDNRAIYDFVLIVPSITSNVLPLEYAKHPQKHDWSPQPPYFLHPWKRLSHIYRRNEHDVFWASRFNLLAFFLYLRK